MDGEPPQEEDFSQIPIPERSQHKNWKARLSAYTDVIAKSAKTASDTDPFFKPFVNDGALLKKWCLDANVVAQEKGIEAVLAIAQYSGESSAKCRPEVVPALVDKALGAARAGTKRKATDLCLMFVEVENNGEGVVTDILPGLDSKQPKVVAGVIAALKEIVESFGVQTVGNIKAILKIIPKIFAHSDKNVRAEGTSLALVLHTYLGAGLAPALADLKPVQQTELQKSFDALDADGKGAGTGKPTRYTRKEQRKREAAEAAGPSGSGGDDGAATGGDAEPEAIDARSLLDPVNVLSLFPADLEERLSSTKWKDRFESLEDCNKVLTAPQNGRISDANVDAYSWLTNTLGAKCKSDANVNVVMEAAKVIEGLAKGLGKPFSRHRSAVMPGCLERLKERKANVTEALGKALDAVFAATTLQDVVEDVLASLKSKNPQVREGTLKFLHRSLCTTLDAPAKDQVKPLAESLVSLLGDSAEPVRATAAECLGTLMKIMGERAFNPYVEGVAELQMGKVKDAFARAEVKYRGGAKGPTPKAPGAPTAPAAAARKPAARPVPSAAPAASPAVKPAAKFGGDDELLQDFSAAPARAPPARFAAKMAASKPAAAPASPPKPATTAPPAAARPPAARPAPAAGPSKPAAVKPAPKAAGGSGTAKALASSPTEPVKFRYTSDEAAARAADLIPANFHTALSDPAWKVRLESAEELVTWTEAEGATAVDAEIMMRFLSKTPGWNEKNFQVSAKVYQVMTVLAEKSPSFGKAPVALAVGHLSDKLGDLKLKKPAGDALTAFAEKTSLAFVLQQAYEPMSKQKAPKAQADALAWIKQQLTDFGIAGIPLRDLIGFTKTALGSPNALVRASATQLLVTVKIFVGGDISGFIEDLNPQLLSTINSEFDKVAGQAPPEPTKTQADLQEVAAGGKGGKGAAADPLDDLVPRVELDKLVAQTTVVADSRSDAWKTRKEAFESLAALLEVKSNSRLKPTMGEIGTVLKKAMADTNLSVKMLALGIISKIATGMGQPFEKYCRLLTPAVASVCADQKATTRAAALATLTAMADATGGLDALYSGLATAIESPNPALRASVLGWMAERLQVEPPTASSDLAPLAAPVISCLEDRNADVRKGAGAVLPFIVASAGYDHVMDQTSSLKPASRSTIIPLIDKAKANAPAKAAPPAAGPPAPARAAGPAAPAAKPRIVPTASAPAPRSAPGSPAPGASAASGIRAPAPARSLAMKSIGSVAAPARAIPTLSSQDGDRPSGLPRARMGIPRPTSAASHATSASSSTTGPASSARNGLPFVSSGPEARATRLKKDGMRWTLDPSPKADLADYLLSQMEPVAAPDFCTQLFSKDHRAEEDFMVALSTLADLYDPSAAATFGSHADEVAGVQMANVDLVLKYAALRLLSNNTQMANRALEVISKVVDHLQRSNERFSEGEARLFVPALVFKLGDSKFAAKLLPIIESLDKIMAGSLVVQLLVQYGLEDKSGKTCKNESLALIERAYRKRGSILKIKDDRAFYEAVARCVNDAGTRSGALSVLALLQLQGGSKTLEGVIEGMPQGSKDMLANRRAAMVTAKSAIPPPGGVSKIAAGEGADTPSRLRRPMSVISPRPRENGAVSPAEASGSPARVPKSSDGSVSSARSSGTPSRARASGSSSGIPAASTAALPRIGASGLPTASSTVPPTEAPTAIAAAAPRSDPFSGKPSLQPLGNGTRLSAARADPILELVKDARTRDINRCVDCLKILQAMLAEEPEQFRDTAGPVIDVVLYQLDWAFSKPEDLLEYEYMRLVKHLIQTASAISSTQDLMRRLEYPQIRGLIHGLTAHLVQADRVGGAAADLARFINLILIQVLATPDRNMVFKAMFSVMLDLIRDFEADNVQLPAFEALHAELVVRCMWKRCKVIDEDFMSGRLQPGPLLVVLENMLREIPPSHFKRRAASNIALGDMPLRTVKTILQKMVGWARETDADIYEVLVTQFGDEAANTVVYSYIFRLHGQVRDSGDARESGSSGSRPSASRSSSSAAAEPTGASQAPGPASQAQLQRPKNGAEKILAKLMLVNGSEKMLDELYAYSSSNPEQEAEVNQAIQTQLPAATQAYVKRMLQHRKPAEAPSPARAVQSRSPSQPMETLQSEDIPIASNGAARGPRKSIGPRPGSFAVDKFAPVDEQLSTYKSFFNTNRASLGPGAVGAAPVVTRRSDDSGSRPLSEIHIQEREPSPGVD